ncbi:MAG TPA: hypothetical protein VGQ99_23535 [Tepidisphaeraceae bacterium]|jgi:hypothetical protein|nr:hypothetical protein [Tepidisphaeraceae bacterium]
MIVARRIIYLGIAIVLLTGAGAEAPSADQQVVAAVTAALGSDPFPDPKVRAAINSFLQETHTNEGLARIVENPAFETSAEASGGYTAPTWVIDPSAQVGVENGHQVGGFTLEKSKDGVGKMSMKVSFNPDEKTITATYNIGPQVKFGNENRLLQKVVAIKFQYRDNEAFLHAMGIDARTLPGGAATLKLMEMLHLKSAETSTLPPETSAIDAAAHAAQRDVLPQIFQSALDFKNVTCGTGYTVSLENGMEAGKGEVVAKRSMTILTQERLEPGQKQGEGVKFAEVAVAVGVGANANIKLSKVAGDVSVGVTYSTDPEKKGTTVGLERRKLAEDIRAGRLADAGALAFQTLAQIAQSSRVSSLVEQTVRRISERQRGKDALDGLGTANTALAEVLRTAQRNIGPMPAEPLVQAVGSAVRALTTQPADPPPPPPRVVIARTKMAVASYQAHLEQAQMFQAAAATGFAEARKEPDPGRREKRFQKVLALQDKRDGLTATLALEFKAASRGATSAGTTAAPPGTSHVNSAHFKSPTFELLKQMAPSSAIAARAFDGAADRAYQEVNRGTGTHFFSLPTASGPQKEPGGIKFSGARAEELAATLDVTSIAFDPVRGRIVLVGAKQTEQTFDLDVFADVLRLAAEEYEPFFSLDPSEPGDWDASLTHISKALAKKYGSEDLARRVRELSPTGIPHGGRIYYYTSVEALDPELAAEANRGRDLTVKLVYSPDWLRYSKVGAILFDGDLAIKAVASGFHDRGGAIEPAFVWGLADFDPVWLHRDDESAGRANFELAHAKVREGGMRLDLVDVHPGLYVTGRRAGTNQDLAPSTHDRAITQHFDKHWREYVAQVPEIGRLEMVFRAYVAARFLIERHPGLAARIQAMPREIPPEQPPLRMVMPTVIRVAFEGENAVPLVSGDEGVYDLSLGYGGGVKFGVEPQGAEKSRVEVQTVPVDSNDWVQGLLAAATYGDEGYSEGLGGGTAVVLYFDSPTLAGMWHLRVVVAVGILVLFAIVIALVLRQFDWQKLASMATCRHCTRIHRRIGQGALLGSAITATAMLYLSLLPLVGAYDAQWSLPQIVAAAIILLAVTLSFVMLGSLVRLASAAARSDAPRSHGPTTAMFTGAHVACIAFGAFLFHRGFSGAAIGSNLARLLSPAVVERVFARLGGIEPMAIASLVAAAGSAIAIFMRWAGPYLFDSRPLPLYRAHSHSSAHP